MTEQHIELNGAPASVNDLTAIAQANYGHFTSMQVQDGCVRGLDLHLQRLDQATRELFGRALDIDQVRAWMRHCAIAAAIPLSLRVTVFARALDRDRLAAPIEADVLVSSAPWRQRVHGPVRLRSVHYVRDLPHIKHVGIFGSFQQKRLAQAEGFDDALFVGADRAVSEGTFWNVGFADGARIVWPDAPALNGISMQMLKAGLQLHGIETLTRRVALADIASFRSAFIINSLRAVVPISSIDGTVLAVDPALLGTLDAVVAAIPWQRL